MCLFEEGLVDLGRHFEVAEQGVGVSETRLRAQYVLTECA